MNIASGETAVDKHADIAAFFKDKDLKPVKSLFM
jgi:hypothetical protein